jgi:DNA-directed RNA polymerase subunit M/transcription elongation factor TFIIS
VVSLANFCPNCGESLGSSSTKKGETRKTARRAYEKPKVKRKASAYNKRYAREYRRLKKKHPRTSFAGLAKKAHKAARRK